MAHAASTHTLPTFSLLPALQAHSTLGAPCTLAARAAAAALHCARSLSVHHLSTTAAEEGAASGEGASGAAGDAGDARDAVDARDAGDAASACQLKRAAALYHKSIRRWRRPDGAIQITKNWFLNSSQRFGYMSYSFFSNYNLLPASWLALAHEFADDSIAECAALADVGGAVHGKPVRFSASDTQSETTRAQHPGFFLFG
jgi:hypothetical protein